MKTAIYLSLLLILPGMLLAKPDSLSADSNKPAAAKVSPLPQKEEAKDTITAIAVKHDTVYVAVKEMPGESVWNMPTIISLTAVLVSLILASISFFTLKEMKAQRKAAYKPELVISRLYINLQKINDTINFYSSPESFEEERIPLESLEIPIHNIGLATAKNIRITTSIDAVALIKIWKELKSENYVDICFRDDNQPQYKIIENIESRYTDKNILVDSCNEFCPLLIVEFFDFILSTASSDETTNSKTYLPKYFAYLYYLYRKHENTSKAFEFPSIYFEITYYNIFSNRPYITKYKLEPVFSSQSGGEKFSELSFYFKPNVVEVSEP